MTQQTGIRRELEAVCKTVGARLRPAVDWHSIDWRQANRNVRRLQRRIVQAQQQGQKRKVRALQFILTRSYSARCLAVRRVTENSGKRHIKVKAAANPYDPTWEPYFEERSALQMKDSLQGYERLIKLWFNQNGRCPSCGEKISRETGWHLHHRKWLVNGGDDSFSNLSLMHPTCHQQLHAQTRRTNDPDCHTASVEAGV